MGRAHLVQAVPVTAVDTCGTTARGVGDVAEGLCQSKSIGWWRSRMGDNESARRGS